VEDVVFLSLYCFCSINAVVTLIDKTTYEKDIFRVTTIENYMKMISYEFKIDKLESFMIRLSFKGTVVNRTCHLMN